MARKFGDVADASAVTASGAGARGSSSTNGFRLQDNVVAQATGIITLASALIVGGGALSLIFRLIYMRVAFTPVLGQLPDSLYLWNGLIEVSVPAVVLSLLLINVVEGRERFQRMTPRVALIVGGALLVAAVGLLIRTNQGDAGNLSGYPWPAWVVALIVGVLTCVALIVTTSKPFRRLSHTLRVIVGAVVFTFVTASVAGCTLLPDVYVCGSGFPANSSADGQHVLRAELIGTSGDYAYVAQFSHVNDGFVVIVPLASVSEMILGHRHSCNTP